VANNDPADPVGHKGDRQLKAQRVSIFVPFLALALSLAASAQNSPSPSSHVQNAGETPGIYVVDPHGRERIFVSDETGLLVEATADLDLRPSLAKLTVAGTVTTTPSTSISPVTPQLISACSNSIKDQANPSGKCLKAGSNPVLGRLYPLSQDLNLDSSGNVGIGTTQLSGRLTVAGVVKTSGGLEFPDSTVQTTATLPGPAGPDGPAGSQGPTGPVGPPGQNGLASINGQPGPALTVTGIGTASVSAGGSTVTVNVPGTLCTYASKTYSKDAFCYTFPDGIPCSFGFRALELRCKADGSWQVVSSSACSNPSFGPVCGF